MLVVQLRVFNTATSFEQMFWSSTSKCSFLDAPPAVTEQNGEAGRLNKMQRTPDLDYGQDNTFG